MSARLVLLELVREASGPRAQIAAVTPPAADPGVGLFERAEQDRPGLAVVAGVERLEDGGADFAEAVHSRPPPRTRFAVSSDLLFM
jgi:hypothetical protein